MTVPSLATTPIDPPPAPSSHVPSPGDLAADAALRRADADARHAQSQGGDPVMTWVDVTPPMAEAWVRKYNLHNRNLRKDDISKYARTMARKAWRQTAEPLKFGVSGNLLDGQHRLLAVVEARVTVRLPIVTGVEDEAQEDMDSGVKRTVGDKLGMGGTKNANNAAGIARMVWDLQTSSSLRPPRPSDTELLEIAHNEPDLMWVANEVMNDLPKVLSKTIAGYCFLRMHRVDPAACVEFFERLKTLENLEKGSPIAALARRIGGLRKYSHKDRVMTVCLVFSAWNSWRAGETRERIMARQFKDGHYEVPELI